MAVFLGRARCFGPEASARATRSDRRRIDAELAQFGAGMSLRQLSRDGTGLSDRMPMDRRSISAATCRTTLRWRGLDSNFQYAGAVNLIVALFCSPRAFHRVRTVGGWMIGRRTVQSAVVSYKGRYC